MFVFYTLLHLTIAIVAYLLWKNETKGRIIFTPMIIFVLLEIAFSWNYWLLFQDINDSVGPKAIILSLVSTFCFLLGYNIAAIYVREMSSGISISTKLHEFNSKPILERRGDLNLYRLLLTGLLILGSIIGWVYYQEAPPSVEGIVLLVSQGDLEEARSIVTSGRKEMTKSHVFGGEYRGQGILKSFTFVLWTYGLILSLILSLKSRKRLWKIYTFLFALGAFVFIAGTGERSRLLWALITAMIGLSLVVRFNAKKVLGAGLILFVVLSAMTFILPRYHIQRSAGATLAQVVASVANRVAMGNKISNLRMINFLDDGTFEYGYGREHLNEFLNVLPGIHRPPLGHRVGEAMGENTTTYYNGTYLGIVYMDFGIVGAVIIYIIIGTFTLFIFSMLIKIPKRIENIAFMSLVIYRLGYMSFSSGLIIFLSGMVSIVTVHILSILFMNFIYKSLYQQSLGTPKLAIAS